MPEIFVSKEAAPQDNKTTNTKPIKTTPQKKVHGLTDKKHKNLRKQRIDTVIENLVAESTVKGSTSSLTSFGYYPKNTRFVNESPEEEILLLLRRHPITNVKWIFIAFLMSLFPVVISSIPYFGLLPSAYQIAIVVIWYFLTAGFVLEEFLTWFFNVNIITDERIVDVDFVHIIYRELSETNIDQVQDVTVRIGGGLRTFFNYGDVVIQTAAEIPQIEFGDVPNPDAVAQVLRELRVEEEVEKIEGRVR